MNAESVSQSKSTLQTVRENLEESKGRSETWIKAYVLLSSLLNFAVIGISAFLQKRFDEIKKDFGSCPDRWLEKQGRSIHDWNVCTTVVLCVHAVHVLLKYLSAYYERLFDPASVAYKCDTPGEKASNSVKCGLFKAASVFLKCVESFLYVASLILPTITWAYFNIFPFDTLNSLLHGKIEGTDEYNYNEVWRSCVPKHTDDVYNVTTAMTVMGLCSLWLVVVADFGKNRSKICLALLDEHELNSSAKNKIGRPGGSRAPTRRNQIHV
ncbi:hypothetical protein CYMTET_47218 [Cymbomonas tetramitiformis]|uniref:Uncharacterized protein n=1 Tax=Cymbomonas tetramitiformis TaxID=36881 RepID=A0AAE0BUK3_9CHLO|nr:hypothetical protein CYMTET_47218 [Cymbomonas tetramitiformis]